MKKFLAMLLALIMMLSLVACGGAPAEEGSADVAMQYITVDEAKALVESDEYVFFDVRKAADAATNSIVGAQSWDMDAAKEGDAEALARQFLAAVHCPVSVLEVVMFDAAELLDISISAVVVGHKEAFGRDNLSGTSSPELHDGIFQRRVVDVIDIFRREFTAELLHCLGIHLLQKRKHPHAFIGPYSAEGYRDCGKYAYNPFHIFVFQKSVGSSCFRWKLLRWCGV